MIDVISLLSEYSIPYTTTHHHSTPGWVNIHCPFCAGRQNFHLGINLRTQACNCWRCGSHSFIDVISACLDVSHREAKKIIMKFASPISSYLLYHSQRREKQKINLNRSITFPFGLLSDLTPMQKRYLKKRGFDVEEIVRLWNIKGIGPVGNYKYRIFIPIIYRGRTVSFQTRATGSIEPKYKACAKDCEIIHHKYLLYGYDYTNKKRVIVVEGPLDVWKMGIGSVCVFGIKYTLMQALFLSQYENVYIMFDNEKTAYYVAKKLAYDVEILGNNNVYIITNYGASDPGELSRKQVEKIKEKVGLE